MHGDRAFRYGERDWELQFTGTTAASAKTRAAQIYEYIGMKPLQLDKEIDGFVADFLNIVERYLVTDKPKAASGTAMTAGTHHSPLTDRI